MEKEEEDDDGGGGRMLLVDRSSRHLFTNWSLEVWRDRYIEGMECTYLPIVWGRGGGWVGKLGEGLGSQL
jgi:hypothetical protein